MLTAPTPHLWERARSRKTPGQHGYPAPRVIVNDHREQARSTIDTTRLHQFMKIATT